MTERFELLSQLGKGGMGVVWKARDTETGEVVALKLLHKVLIDDPDYVARFEREVEISRRIQSPNVVRTLGYGTQDGIPYMAMEYVDGSSLRDFVKERGHVEWATARPILRQIAEGLAAAHRAGVIHRDIKPSNVLIAPDRTAKLADFGIARAADMTRLTGGSTVLGTPHYMAPDTEASEASDLYAFGCIAFEMLTGVPPFTGESSQQVMMKHIREEPKLTGLPPEPRPLVEALLAKERSQRPRSASAVAKALADVRHDETRVPRHRRVPWRKMVVGSGVLSLLGAAALAIVVFVASESPPTAAKPVFSSDAAEADVINQLNEARTASGLPPLVRDARIDLAAARAAEGVTDASACTPTPEAYPERAAGLGTVISAPSNYVSLVRCTSDLLGGDAATVLLDDGASPAILNAAITAIGVKSVEATASARNQQPRIVVAVDAIAPGAVTWSASGTGQAVATPTGFGETLTGIDFPDGNRIRLKLDVHGGTTYTMFTLGRDGSTWLTDQGGNRFAPLEWSTNGDDVADASSAYLPIAPGFDHQIWVSFAIPLVAGTTFTYTDGLVTIPSIVLASDGSPAVPATVDSPLIRSAAMSALSTGVNQALVTFMDPEGDAHLLTTQVIGSDGGVIRSTDAVITSPASQQRAGAGFATYNLDCTSVSGPVTLRFHIVDSLENVSPFADALSSCSGAP